MAESDVRAKLKMVPEEAQIISKTAQTHIVIDSAPYNGHKQVNLREFIITERYIGATKMGFVVPAEKWEEFKAAVNAVKL